MVKIGYSAGRWGGDATVSSCCPRMYVRADESERTKQFVLLNSVSEKIWWKENIYLVCRFFPPNLRTMEIYVDGQHFTFDDNSEVRIESGGLDLKIIEPGFDQKSRSLHAGRFVSKSIRLPASIECRIRRTGLQPCSGVYKDAQGKRMFDAYFD